MNSFIKIFSLTFFLYVQVIFSFCGEYKFYIDDDDNQNYKIIATRYSLNEPLFGINYMMINNSSCNNVITSNPTMDAGEFEFYLAFDVIRDTWDVCYPLIGEGKYIISIVRDEEVIFRFKFDNLSFIYPGSMDIRFEYRSTTGTLKAIGISEMFVGYNQWVYSWEMHNLARNILPWVKNLELTNSVNGNVVSQLKNVLDNAPMGFPYEYYQPGTQFNPETFANFWLGGFYGISINQEYYSTNKFRSWDVYNDYNKATSLQVLPNIDRIRSLYHPTHPLTVTNNLEGGTSNDEFEIKWQDAGITYPWEFNSSFSAFNYESNSDDYTIKALPITAQRFGTNWTFKNWNTGSTYDTIRDIRVSAPTIYTTNYKGHFRSNNSTASGSNGQRKLLRDQYGKYHLIYTSMNRLWYTKSLTTDYGGSWLPEVDLNGDYDPDFEIKNPSIDIMGDEIVAVVEYKQLNVETVIYLLRWNVNASVPISPSYELMATIQPSYFGQAYPVVAYTYLSVNNSKEIFVLYRTSLTGGLKYSRRHFVNGILTESQNEISLSGTSIQSKNPSIAGSKSTHKVFIVYEDEQRYIRHIESDHDYIHSERDFANIENISSGSGYRYNYSPSISLFGQPGLSFLPIVSWTVTDNEVNKQVNDQAVNTTKISVRPNNGPYLWGNILIVGSAASVSQNSSTPNTNGESVIVWSENVGTNNKWVKRINGTYNTTKCLSPSGKGLMVSNGSGLTNIKALIFNDNSLPYSFNKSADNFNLNIECSSGGGELGKITEAGTITFGRSRLVLKKGVEFIFNIGDVVVNDSIIQLIEKHDTTQYETTDELNEVVRTYTFELNSDADFIFSNLYYVNNSDFADTSLTSVDVVSFRAELVNASTGNVAGTFDEITFRKNNLSAYENIAYEVNCVGIQSGEYYLRLVTNVTGEAEYNLANVQTDASIIKKKTFHTVYFDGSQLPKEYDLAQNYPNPFNPTTVINYQIPQDGLVTIKVYDILGKEVTTLVNENKSVGRYSVQFNGDNLASGVYIYRINSGDFVSSKKMMLIK